MDPSTCSYPFALIASRYSTLAKLGIYDGPKHMLIVIRPHSSSYSTLTTFGISATIASMDLRTHAQILADLRSHTPKVFDPHSVQHLRSSKILDGPRTPAHSHSPS